MDQDEIERRHEQFLPEAARLGQDLDLGPCTAARAARHHAPQFGCGAGMVTVAVFLGVPWLIASSGTGRLVGAIMTGGVALTGLVLMARWPSVTWDRLFRYDGGLAQIRRGEPEPACVRWADVDTVSLSFGMDDDTWDLDSCIVSSQTGTTVRVDSAYSVAFLGEVTAEAERVLAARLVPDLIRRYESGELVTFGPLTIGQPGLGYTNRFAETSQTTWDEITRIDVDGPGRGFFIRAERGTSHPRQWIDLRNCPNGVLAHHVIEHAVAGTTITVHHVSRHWPRTPSPPPAKPEDPDPV